MEQANWTQSFVQDACARIQRETEMIVSTTKAQGEVCERLVAEKTDLQSQLKTSLERSFLISIEMMRQREIMNRLENIIMSVTSSLDQEQQSQLSNAMYQAKQFSLEDLKNMVEAELGVNLDSLISQAPSINLQVPNPQDTNRNLLSDQTIFNDYLAVTPNMSSQLLVDQQVPNQQQKIRVKKRAPRRKMVNNPAVVYGHKPIVDAASRPPLKQTTIMDFLSKAG